MEFYKKERKVMSSKDVSYQQKLINLVNQEKGTNYNLNSVGIELVVVANPGNYRYGEPDKNFGFRTRAGVPYKNYYTEAEKKELLSARRYY